MSIDGHHIATLTSVRTGRAQLDAAGVSRGCFSSDCFGRPLPGRDLALADDVGANSGPPWTARGSPGWTRAGYAATLRELAANELPLVLPPFVGPDQQALEAMLAGFAPSV